MSEPSDSSCERGILGAVKRSNSTLAPLAGRGVYRFGTFPAAIRIPSGLPEIASPLMNERQRIAEATVVKFVDGDCSRNGFQATHQGDGMLTPVFAAPLAVPPLATGTWERCQPGGGGCAECKAAIRAGLRSG